MRRSRPAPFALCLAGGIMTAAAPAAPARAGTIEVIAARPLEFGGIVVMGSGTKQIAPDGLVTANGLISVPGSREGPGEFVLRYRPDGRARAALILISVTTSGSQLRDGSTGALSLLQSDLPGTSLLALGEVRQVRLPPCADTVCETRFRIGGTLSMSGGVKQTTFSFPLQVTARLLGEF